MFVSWGLPLVRRKSTEISEERCLHQARKQHEALLATFSTLLFCLAYSSTMMIEATCSSEISADFQQATWHYIPENRTVQIFNCLEHSLNFYD